MLYYIFTSKTTEQNKIDFDKAVRQMPEVGLEDNQGNLIYPQTTKYSEFIPHPTDGRFYYQVDDDYINAATKPVPSTYDSGADDVLYDMTYITNQGWNQE